MTSQEKLDKIIKLMTLYASLCEVAFNQIALEDLPHVISFNNNELISYKVKNMDGQNRDGYYIFDCTAQQAILYIFNTITNVVIFNTKNSFDEIIVEMENRLK